MKMKLLERLKQKWKEWFGKGDVKKVKVTPKILRDNIAAINEKERAVKAEIDEVLAKKAKIDQSTEEGLREYDFCQNRLKELTELYSTFQKEKEEEYTILKKHRDSGIFNQAKEGVMIGGVIFLGVFMVALERENPKALKLATFLLKLFPMKFM